MGKRSRRRRHEHQPRGPDRGQPRRPRDDRGRSLGDHDVLALLHEAGSQRLDGNEPRARDLVGLVAASTPTPADRRRIGILVDTHLAERIGRAWSRGWQPGDLPRLTRMRLRARDATLVVDAIAAEAEASGARSRAHPAWLAQLEGLEEARAGKGWHRAEPLLPQWGARAGVDWPETLRCAAGVLTLLALLPPIPVLIPPPGSNGAVRAHARVEPPAGVDPKVLTKVRSLLAKAESTTFEEEAAAFTAKAQELMARHSISRAVADALLAGDSPRGAADGEEPLARRIGVDPPYAGAKLVLLGTVAHANRCRAVWNRDLGFATLFGFEVDLEATEVLYTSLLVQATTMMRAAEATPDHPVRSRRRSFRQSFLLGFADRIGQRLEEAAAATVAEAEHAHGASLLPVLAGRTERVEAACDEVFPGRTGYRPRVSHRLGYIAGTVAGHQASLRVRSEVRAAS